MQAHAAEIREKRRRLGTLSATTSELEEDTSGSEDEGGTPFDNFAIRSEESGSETESECEFTNQEDYTHGITQERFQNAFEELVRYTGRTSLIARNTG